MIVYTFEKKDVSEKPPFETVYEKYYTSVLRYLQKKTGNLQDAEDLAAETFLYCFRNYERYDPEKSAVSTWLFLAANSRLKNYYRDRREHADFSELEEYLFAEEADMERAVFLEELRGVMSDMLRKLPERQQKAVVMRFFQQKDFREIAAEMETTPGNARVILARALDKLEKEFSAVRMDWSV